MLKRSYKGREKPHGNWKNRIADQLITLQTLGKDYTVELSPVGNKLTAKKNQRTEKKKRGVLFQRSIE